MRKQKDLCITTDARGEKGKADFTAASIKLWRQKDIYEDFCKQTGNYTEYERTFVQRYNRHLSGKTGAVTRKQRAAANTQITLPEFAKGDDYFTIFPPIKGDAVTPKNLYNALNKNEIGQQALQYIREGNATVEINYTDQAPENLRGYTTGHQIVIFAANEPSVKGIASTIVHEVTHAKYKIGGNQWAEAHCFAAEYIFSHGDLTFAAKRDIIKEVKKLYPDYEWRRKQDGRK